MSSESLFTRDEVLGGLSAKRARMVLYLIENRTAHLAAMARQATARFPTDLAETERETAFLQALALGREPAQRPAIQDLEHFAPDWAPLVPDNPRLRATLAHLFAERYRIVERETPRLTVALGLKRNRFGKRLRVSITPLCRASMCKR